MNALQLVISIAIQWADFTKDPREIIEHDI